MPEWKQEIRQRLASLELAPAREAEIVEEFAQRLEDCYAELLVTGEEVLNTSPLIWRQIWVCDKSHTCP